MTSEPPAQKTAAQIAKEKEDEEAQKVGYRASEFKWFGDSTPPSAMYECLMCDSVFHIEKKDLISQPPPEVCPNCRRKALKIYNGKEWEAWVRLKLYEFELFTDQYNESYAACSNSKRQVFCIEGLAFRRLLALRCKNKNQIGEATAYMDGLAGRKGEKVILENRVAKNEDGIWIDAASEQGEAIQITPDGWRIVDKPPLLFRQFDHQLPIIIEQGAKKDLDEYVSMMNLSSEKDKLLYMGYAATLFMPQMDKPILMPLGPQGSAKTTMSLMTRMIADPSRVPLLTLPREPEKLPLLFYSHYLPLFDNVGYISQEISDALCRATSGGGDTTRKLYTNKDMTTMTFRSPIILNGISAPSHSNDLVDRALIINLDRILECNRKEKRVLEARRDELLPKVRGYLLTTLADALQEGPTQTNKLPRMADFAKLADACLAQMGYPRGKYLELYMEFAQEAAMEAVRSDPLADALLEFLDDKEEWKGTASELKRILEVEYGGNIKSPLWPKDSTRLSESLFGRLRPGLSQMNWNLARLPRSGARRAIRFYKEGEMKETANDAV